MEIAAIIPIGFVLITVGILFFLFGIHSSMAGKVSQRLHEYVIEYSEDPKQQAIYTSSRKAELAGSFRTRILVPSFRKLSSFFGRIAPGRLSSNLENQLAIAGNPMGLGAREFYGIRIAFTLLGIAVAYFLLQGQILPSDPISDPITIGGVSLIPESTNSQLNPTMLFASVLALFLISNLPKSWLRRKIRTRTDAIRKALPDALDMLSVCADAGLGFDQSLQRVSEHWDDALAKEFGRVVSEMGMGVSRATAMRNLANRANVAELSSFVAVILQSDQLGMSITQTLHAQAKQMRIERRFRAQEQARKMPLKMLFPLMLLIFPAMFAVILGPMIPVLGELFTVLRGGA
ncbi:MAG: type II secretion system F family protein [Anaerolineales bacterium]|nr:type II secretion system F family protein [Anaerolineales bacterium]